MENEFGPKPVNYTPDLPRPDYPRPQFRRGEGSWISLNGEWEFAIDPNGYQKGFTRACHLDRKINLPFAPESTLSGIGEKGIMTDVWYTRQLDLPSSFLDPTKRVLLHIGASDYQTNVFHNGELATRHEGGYTSFSADITPHKDYASRITIWAHDDTRDESQPSGKQAMHPDHDGNYGCHYDRTTGIHQSVWVESVPRTYLSHALFTPDLQTNSVAIKPMLKGDHSENLKLSIKATAEGNAIGQVEVSADSDQVILPLADVPLWDPDHPNLTDLTFSLYNSTDGKTVDEVFSYFGMRDIRVENGKFMVNGRPVFLRQFLSQGFYGDGIYTPESVDQFDTDIALAKSFGANGLRLHQRVFEEGFHTRADKAGLLNFGEYASWGIDPTNPKGQERLFHEWTESMVQTYNHPSLVAWYPMNEDTLSLNGIRVTGYDLDFNKQIYELTKKLDPSRPAAQTSGWTHNPEVPSDIISDHFYTQDENELKDKVAEGLKKSYQINPNALYLVDEMGGTKLSNTEGWGYGTVRTEDEYVERFDTLVSVIANNPKVAGDCWTQDIDTYQEENGLAYANRLPKINPESIYESHTRPAAIEHI